MSRECDKKECFANVNGICDALKSAIKPNCPFFKTEVQAVLENGALTASPADWKAFRKFSGTKLPKAEELAAWLFKLEEIKPTDDPDVTAKLKALFGGSDVFVLKSEVIEKMTDWFKSHPEGCGWCMSPEETAKRILEREVGEDDETDTTDAAVSSEPVSE